MEFASNRLTLAKFFGGLAIFISLFPWVGFNIFNTDSQPWALIFFVIFMATIPKRLITPKNFYILFLILIFGIFISVFQSNNIFSFLTIRAIYSLFSFCNSFYRIYNYLLRFGFPFKIFYNCKFYLVIRRNIRFSPDMLQYVAPQRTSSGRGMTSFAPEPSFFAFIYFFFLHGLFC